MNYFVSGRSHRDFLLIYFLMLLLLSACSSNTNNPITSDSAQASPTTHPLMNSSGGSLLETRVIKKETIPAPSNNDLFGQNDIPTPIPTPTRVPTSTPNPAEPTPVAPRFRDVTIYNDQLDANWTLNNSAGLSYDAQSSTTVYTGTVAISAVPEKDFGILFFTVDQNTSQSYLRNEVLGIRFQINSGNDYLGREEMAVSVLGSNEIPYWSNDDKSVESTLGEYPFSETRLSFLGINQDIPPNTWVEVEIWLDNLIFDPDYLYVTGFYIKNGDGYRTNYFVDDVALIFAERPAPTPSPSPNTRGGEPP